jgi:predicted dehydrogenase
MSHLTLNRRDFLKCSAASAGVVTLGSALPPLVLGANDRVNVGIIGVGGKGMDHLRWLQKNAKDENVRIAAVCDVYQRRISRAAAQAECDGFMDYRKLLERKDIDAVFVVTPDHWHSKISIDAMEAGKHVYCEKPMTLTIEQALAVRDAVKRYNKVLQVGPNGTARSSFWKAQQVIREGRVGKVTWAQGSANRNIRGCAFNVWFPIDPTAGPDKSGDDYVNWDMWLGHEWGLAPKIPWNPEHFFRFRKYWPYNGGVATDLIYHSLAPLLLAIAGSNGEYPKRVSAGGGLYVEKDGRDIPDVFAMIADYPGEYTLNLMSVLTNDTPLPTRIYGKYGTIELKDDAILSGNGDFVEEFKEKNGGYSQVTLPLEKRKDLQGNFLDVIRQGGTLCCNAELGAATMVAIKMAVESYRQNKTMLWDAANERLA